MSRVVSIGKGRTYTTDAGAFVTLDEFNPFYGTAKLKGFDVARRAWVLWTVNLVTFMSVIHDGLLKRRKKPSSDEVGVGVARLPKVIRPGAEVEVLS